MPGAMFQPVSRINPVAISGDSPPKIAVEMSKPIAMPLKRPVAANCSGMAEASTALAATAIRTTPTNTAALVSTVISQNSSGELMATTTAIPSVIGLRSARSDQSPKNGVTARTTGAATVEMIRVLRPARGPPRSGRSARR
jgi:hypothetical protein